MAWLTQDQITEMSFGTIGSNVLLSNKASFYNCQNIHIGNNVRIDDFCVISAGEGGIYIGSFIHVAVFTSLIGAGRILLEDFANLSSRVAIYSSTDDFTGTAMTNPMVPAEFTSVSHAPVRIGRHVIIGSGSVVLPGVVLEEGASVGALSLVNTNCDPFGIYAGVPAKFIAQRSRKLLDVEQDFLSASRGS
jgi:galactoside O-acetyltransferase